MSIEVADREGFPLNVGSAHAAHHRLLGTNCISALARITAVICVAVLMVTLARSSYAQQGVLDHLHSIDIDAPPVVRRLVTHLANPVRVRLTSEGLPVILDSSRGELLRVSADGVLLSVTDGLHEPLGMTFTHDQTAVVAEHAGGRPGMGRLTQVFSDGTIEPIVEGLNGPTDVVVGEGDSLFAICAGDGTLIRVSRSGEWEIVAVDLPQPTALVRDISGDLYCSCAGDGTVRKISPSGSMMTLCEGLSAPADLAFDSKSRLIVASMESRALFYISSEGKTKTFALVPAGTISLEFDQQDNLFFINARRQELIKVLMNMCVDCPHCPEQLQLRFRRPARKAPLLPLPPSQPSGPVI
ncbi:SMP-30/gluconolactonase/LRE family protein [Calycomorphotria hydatis]|uniref:Virginiamycin B lyase n=1 Tax=Calycomorphotria hydatis TaxID=2528027 RepID=A0A517T8T8_9PLAN|nr:hypothetical protein [Calycomorphotria hydatis]QDT64794.1 Virginiamycin B lyase [Calycomorphotria hydatis]